MIYENKKQCTKDFFFFFKERMSTGQYKLHLKNLLVFFFIMKYLIICDSGVHICARAHVLSHYIATVNVAEE